MDRPPKFLVWHDFVIHVRCDSTVPWECRFVIHGSCGKPSGRIVEFEAPGAGSLGAVAELTAAGAGTFGGQGTRPSTNDAAGAITGWIIDSNYVNHGFLWVP
jgi:hypothetical protein